MNRISLSLDSLTSQSSVAKGKAEPSAIDREPATERKVSGLVQADLLKPSSRAKRQGGNQTASGDADTKHTPEAVSAGSVPSPAPNSAQSEKSQELLASTCCANLLLVKQASGRTRCLLKPRHEKDQFMLEWFHREVEFLSGRKSEYLLTVKPSALGGGVSSGSEFITESVVESLETRIRRKGNYSALQARVLLAEGLKALEEYHKLGRLHGELTPGRLLYGPADRLMLFGSPGYRAEDELRPQGSGDLFAAPEILNSEDFGSISKASDLYCLGQIVLYSMLGRSYFALLKVRDQDAPQQAECLAWHGSNVDRLPELEELLPEAPPTLVSVLGKLVEKDPRQRYQSTHEALADLNALFTKTKSGKLAKRQRSRRSEVTGKEQASEGPRPSVTPPPLINLAAEDSASSQISRLPRRVLLCGLVMLMLGVVTSWCFQSGKAEVAMENTVEASFEGEVANRSEVGDDEDIASSNSSESIVTPEAEALEFRKEADGERPEAGKLADASEAEGLDRAADDGAVLLDDDADQYPETPELSLEQAMLLEDEEQTPSSELEREPLSEEQPSSSKGDEGIEAREAVPSRGVVIADKSEVEESSPPSAEAGNSPVSEILPSERDDQTSEFAGAAASLEEDAAWEEETQQPEDMKASWEYLNNLEQLIDSYRSKSHLKRHESHAPWFESTAKKVDLLETEAVLPEVVQAGIFVSQALRTTASKLREASFGSTNVNNSSGYGPLNSDPFSSGSTDQRNVTKSSPQAMSQDAFRQIRVKLAEVRGKLQAR